MIICQLTKIKQKKDISLLSTTHFSVVFQFASDHWSFKCQVHQGRTMRILWGFSFVCVCRTRKGVVLAAQSSLCINAFNGNNTLSINTWILHQQCAWLWSVTCAKYYVNFERQREPSCIIHSIVILSNENKNILKKMFNSSFNLIIQQIMQCVVTVL